MPDSVLLLFNFNEFDLLCTKNAVPCNDSHQFVYINLHQTLFFYFNHYGKDFASCQNLCPKNLLMYLIYQQ